MSREERLMAKGVIAEKKLRIRALETEIEGLRLVIRDSNNPFIELDARKSDLICQSAQRLKNCVTERDAVAAELQRLEDEWGD